MVLSIYRRFSESTNFCSKERWLRPVAMMIGHVKIVNPCFIATRGKSRASVATIREFCNRLTVPCSVNHVSMLYLIVLFVVFCELWQTDKGLIADKQITNRREDSVIAVDNKWQSNSDSFWFLAPLGSLDPRS